MENLIVQKYGGTSVGNIERIKRIAKKIVETKNRGNNVIVVVSAMGDTTDKLVEKAKTISENPPAREMDMLLSTGEQISISLLAIAIETLGVSVVSLTGGQCGIITDTEHKKARIINVDDKRIEKELVNDKIVIAAGFQGITKNKDITTLGRGGSDTTAVALASALKAKKCEIYTDVDGVYTADPRKVKEATKLKQISYDEMLELASLGAGVLHPRSVELARKFNIPLEVKSSFEDIDGTEIVEVDKVEKVMVRGVSLDDKISKISVLEVPDKPGVAHNLFSSLLAKNINVDMIIQSVNHENVNDISFTVKSDDLNEAIEICNRVAKDIGAKEVLYDSNVSKLSVVGTGIAGSSEVASTLFGSLFELDINIQMISTSEIKVSCIIDSEKADKAMIYIHSKFKLGGIEISQ